MHDEGWPSYWSADLSDKLRRSLEDELRREVPIGHVLHGKPVVAKAIGEHPDDVVFQLPDGRLAVVHLTWDAESRPDSPFTLIFRDRKSLAESDEWG